MLNSNIKQQHMEEDFKTLNTWAVVKFEDCDFSNISNSELDWRNYLPESVAGKWNELTERERKLVFMMAQLRACDQICVS